MEKVTSYTTPLNTVKPGFQPNVTADLIFQDKIMKKATLLGTDMNEVFNNFKNIRAAVDLTNLMTLLFVIIERGKSEVTSTIQLFEEPLEFLKDYFESELQDHNVIFLLPESEIETQLYKTKTGHFLIEIKILNNTLAVKNDVIEVEESGFELFLKKYAFINVRNFFKITLVDMILISISMILVLIALCSCCVNLANVIRKRKTVTFVTPAVRQRSSRVRKVPVQDPRVHTVQVPYYILCNSSRLRCTGTCSNNYRKKGSL